MEVSGIQCCNCGKIVNSPAGEQGQYLSNRPSSYWVDTSDGRPLACCFPCSWNGKVAAQYPKLQYKKKKFSKTAVAKSAHSGVTRGEKIQVSDKTWILKMLGWLGFGLLVLIGALNSHSDTAPSDGFLAELNAENSINDGGTFDNQSKP